MADERNPSNDSIENDDPTSLNEERIAGRADEDDEEFEDIEDEDEDAGGEEGE